jgi:hypothetical protein
MDPNLLNKMFDQITNKTGMQFDDEIKNNVKDVFEKIKNPIEKLSEDKKELVINLNNCLNSFLNMNVDEIFEILNYITNLNKHNTNDLVNLPNFERNQHQLLFIVSSLYQIIKQKEGGETGEENKKGGEGGEEEKTDSSIFDKLIDDVLNDFDEIDLELKDELDELELEKESPKTLENSLGDLSKLIELAKDLTSKVNLDNNPIDFNKLTDKDYFNKVVKNIQEKDDSINNSEEISKIVDSNPLLKSIHDQLLTRMENNKNIDYDFVKDMSEKIVKDL